MVVTLVSPSATAFSVVLSHSAMSDSVIPWTGIHQAPLSMGFSRQEYWRGLPCPPPGDLPKPGIKLVSPMSPALQTDSLPAEPLQKPLPLSKIYPYIFVCLVMLGLS